MKTAEFAQLHRQGLSERECRAIEESSASVKTRMAGLARHPSLSAAGWSSVRQGLQHVGEVFGTIFVKAGAPLDLSLRSFPLRLRRVHSFRRYPIDAPREAELEPDSAGFTIWLRDDQAGHRQRATIAHEIGHTFFFDIERSPPTRWFRIGTDTGAYVREEDLCWAFARALLLPETLLRVDPEVTKEPSANLLAGWAARRRVSAALLARRLMYDLGLWGSSRVVMPSWRAHRIAGRRRTVDVVRGLDSRGGPWSRLEKLWRQLVGALEQRDWSLLHALSETECSQAGLVVTSERAGNADSDRWLLVATLSGG